MKKNYIQNIVGVCAFLFTIVFVILTINTIIEAINESENVTVLAQALGLTILSGIKLMGCLVGASVSFIAGMLLIKKII